MTKLIPIREKAVPALHRLLLSMRRRRLRRLTEAAFRVVARGAAAYLTRGERGAATYVRGGLGSGDFVPGSSDIDLAIVLATDASAARARARWQRLRRLPAAELLVDWPRVYSAGELRDLAGATALTYGGAAYLGEAASLDAIRMLERPGLYGATADWRLLAGPERRPPEPERDAQARRLAAWLELVYWWRLVFPFCADPALPRSADLAVKLVAEAARIWLWLAHGERAPTRADALRLAAHRLPEEEDSLLRARALLRALPGAPAAPLDELLPAAVRLSARVADLIAAQVAEEGALDVRLVGDPHVDGDSRPLPLADWRAVVCADSPDESFRLVEGDPGDPAVLAAATAAMPSGPYPALRAGGVMILPALSFRRTRLRSLKSGAADPVPFALVEGARTASFPRVRGWSAEDMARRAVAEHRARLGGEAGAPGERLGLLLGAARAALFHESLEEGESELCLTTAAAARRLAARSPAARDAAEEALERFRDFALRGNEPPAGTVAALRELVLGLPAWARP